MLFTEFVRTDSRPKANRESAFAFLDRSARPEMERVRQILEHMTRGYPEDELADLVGRIRSGNDIHFKSAIFELSLYTFLVRLGYQLEPHPELENGLKSRPDFLVTAPDGSTFYLEAVLASQNGGTDPAAEARIGTTLDVLAQATHPNFMIGVESEGTPTSQPSGNRLRSAILKWLDSLDPDDIQKLIMAEGLSNAPSLNWSHEDWQVVIRPIPLKPERRGKAKTLIGVMDGRAGLVDEWTPIRNAVKFKGAKYGDLQRPMLVAVNFDSGHLDQIDEMQALYGQEQFIFSVAHPDREPRFHRAANGAWYGHNGPQAQRVSGVWLFNDLNAYTLALRRHTVYFNPWALRALPESLKRLPHAVAIEEEVRWEEGLSFRQVFELPEGWPE